MPGKGKPFEKGDPRAGRPKGSKNVKTLMSASAFLAQVGRNPVEELIKLADKAPDSVYGREFKKSIWIAIIPYCEAPQKDPAPRSASTPDESVANAQAVAAHLAELSKALEPTNDAA